MKLPQFDLIFDHGLWFSRRVIPWRQICIYLKLRSITTRINYLISHWRVQVLLRLNIFFYDGGRWLFWCIIAVVVWGIMLDFIWIWAKRELRTDIFNFKCIFISAIARICIYNFELICLIILTGMLQIFWIFLSNVLFQLFSGGILSQVMNMSFVFFLMLISWYIFIVYF